MTQISKYGNTVLNTDMHTSPQYIIALNIPCYTAISVYLYLFLHSDIECMGCHVILTEDKVLAFINKPQTREKYLRFSYEEYVNVSFTLTP